MTDILIYRGSYRGTKMNVIARSEVGRKWMCDNMILSSPHIASIQRDSLECFIDELKVAHIEYEIV